MEVSLQVLSFARPEGKSGELSLILICACFQHSKNIQHLNSWNPSLPRKESSNLLLGSQVPRLQPGRQTFLLELWDRSSPDQVLSSLPSVLLEWSWLSSQEMSIVDQTSSTAHCEPAHHVYSSPSLNLPSGLSQEPKRWLCFLSLNAGPARHLPCLLCFPAP